MNNLVAEGYAELPFPHKIIDDFLPEDLFIRLCEFLEEVETSEKECDLFQFEQSNELTAIKNPVLLELQEYLRKETGRKQLDMFAAFYHDTDYLLPHDDRLEGRKIAYTFYLAAPEAGGELSLIETKEPYEKHSIAVVPNRLVLFEVSEKSWHEVEEVRGELPRISISGWFHD